MARQAESKRSKKIIEYLQSEGFKAWKNAGGPFQEGGRPDVMAWRAPHFLCIETKMPDGGMPTALQTKWLREAADKGAIAMCARSVDEVRERLLMEGVL